MTRSQLRKHLRQTRRSLTVSQQQHHADKLNRQIRGLTHFKPKQKVAVYLANDGEISPKKICQALWKRGAKVYLPILQSLIRPHLKFVEYTPKTQWKTNRFGIKEPVHLPHQRFKAQQLDWILMPLVGFDEAGNRLGMGGGFYDRTLSYKLNRKTAKPNLVGLAHECQKVKKLPFESWDVPMRAVVTERKVYYFKNN